MARMSKDERKECERNLATCEAAVQTLKKMIEDDDREGEKAVRSSTCSTIKGIAERDGMGAAILAIRETPNRISDAVHSDRKK